MAYRFDSADDDVRFTPGALTSYTMGPVTMAALINRNETSTWHGIVTILDAGGGDGSTPVLIDALEIDDTNHLSFWNGRGSPASAEIAGAASTSFGTDTTNWFVVAVSWGGASTAPKFHWKQLSSGSWTHQAISDGTGQDCKPIVSADRIIIGTDPSGGDDFGGDVVWAGIVKSNVADATIENLDTLSFQTVVDFGWDWLVGFEASGTQTDRTGGGGDQASISGTSLVSDPGSWDWTLGGGGAVTPKKLSALGVG